MKLKNPPNQKFRASRPLGSDSQRGTGGTEASKGNSKGAVLSIRPRPAERPGRPVFRTGWLAPEDFVWGQKAPKTLWLDIEGKGPRLFVDLLYSLFP